MGTRPFLLGIKMNVRYEIDREAVLENVNKKLAEIYERLDERIKIFEKAELPLGTHVDWYYETILHEVDYYSTVRIIRIAPKKYILVYGSVKDSTVTEGTGPFKTLTKAANWFLGGGR